LGSSSRVIASFNYAQLLYVLLIVGNRLMMHDFEILLGLLAAVAVLAVVAQKLQIPYPILLVLGGLAASIDLCGLEYILARLSG
jgi:hypothetical protein